VTDPKCDDNCRVGAIVIADCPAPRIAVETSGFANATRAARLRSTLDTHLGPILSLRARFMAMAELAGSVTGNADTIATIKLSCIPTVISRSVSAASEVTAGAEATAAVATSTGAPLSGSGGTLDRSRGTP
jgi:hypothetical protein